MSGKIEIIGGLPLRGRVEIRGAKNSALPILAATVLTRGESKIRNCPALSDVRASLEILKYLGCCVRFRDGEATVDSTELNGAPIPETLMREMRSSIIFLGAVLARFGEARLCAPGGCDIGLRPIDLHLGALGEMGARVREGGGMIVCTCPDGLRGADISLSFPSVGATENVMLAACAAKGTTRIFNAAREPEIEDLAAFLNCAGARIRGAGSAEIVIEGGKRLSGCEHTVIADRIAAGSYLAAAAITAGSVTAVGARAEHLRTVLPVFRAMGCEVTEVCDGLRLDAPQRLDAVRYIRTMPYPGFPTDLQAPLTACMCVARGTGIVRETIFENRYKHVPGLIRLGADIRLEGGCAVIRGVDRLTGAHVEATDLRGGFALVLAGLAAEGKTTVSGTAHIDRGYENVCGTLRSLGARVCARQTGPDRGNAQ
ncbi:MAG: UDP-N-acetylglucosamine 1-carboxyvinyltransferase [Clostridia bacterium]|nr:UDP-N-acetylglucosamine 1-carboxyvinyltransferase [Clostridia bacterium]